MPDLTKPGSPCAPNAQHAVRQAKRLADNLVADLHGKPMSSYKHAYAGSVAGLGLHQGVAQIYGVRLKGPFAWLLHRTYHLSRMPTLNRKIRVAADWTLALPFRRETVSLGALQRPRQEFEPAAGRRPDQPAEGGSRMQDGAASRLAPLLVRILLGTEDARGSELPIRVRAWDGSVIGPATAPTFVIRHRRALRRLLWKPGEIGLVRAYIAGDLDIEGDVFAALGAVQRVMRIGDQPIRLSSDDKREIVRSAVMLGAVGPEPKAPPEEFPVGRRGQVADGPLAVDPVFFERMLGPTMAYGCALWDDAVDLDHAQGLAHAAMAARLGLAPGARLFDLSRGWGSFSLYAAAEHGVRVVTLAQSQRQAEHLRQRASQAGLADRVDVRVGDLHAVGDGQYDAIAGLAGTEQADLLNSGSIVPRLYELLAPGGRLLVQQMVRRPGPHPVRRTFTTSYMFPENAELRPLGEIVTALEEGGLEIRGISALREHHARTFRAWAANLQRHWAECGALATPGRARVWLLYLAASALACESGRIGVHEIYAVRRDREGRAGETMVEHRAVYRR